MSQIVIVTGAGSGLGRALARALAMRGDVVIGVGRRAAALEETGSELAATHFAARPADVADAAEMAAVAAETLAAHGRIDGVFANAAVYPHAEIHAHAPRDWMETIAINLGGVYNICHAVLPAMEAEAAGRIVIVGSHAWKNPTRDSSAYAVSKGAVHVLAKALASEVGPDYPNILVNLWVPGQLKTGMGIESGIEPELAAQWGLKVLDLPPGGPNGEVFERDRQAVAPQSLKSKVKARLLGR